MGACIGNALTLWQTGVQSPGTCPKTSNKSDHMKIVILSILCALWAFHTLTTHFMRTVESAQQTATK